MASPVIANNTCDIYRTGNAPPATPDVAGVACRLKAQYRLGLEHGEGDATSKKFDHVLIVDCSTDIRDAYNAGSIGSTADTVYVPDKNGTGFKVVYVELVAWGTPAAYKRVFLARLTATWPTLNL